MVDKMYCIRKTLQIVDKVGLSKEQKKLSDAEKESKKNEKAAVTMAHELSKGNRKRYNAIKAVLDDFVKNPYDKKYWTGHANMTEAQYKDLLSRYVNARYKVLPATGIDANNNEIFDISYSILTSEQNAAKALKPGGFEPYKQAAFAIAAYRDPEIRKQFPSLNVLLNMSVEELSKLLETEGKNLIFLDTQLEYYDHNNSASSLLSISAVNSVSHAILVDDYLGIDISDIMLPIGIGEFIFSGIQRLDPPESINGEFIDESLGSCVAASADAAKDPILDIMNLNPKTFNVFMALTRIGVPRTDALLLMSSDIMTRAISQANKRTLAGEWCTPESWLREFIEEDNLNRLGYSPDSQIWSEPLTREQLIKGLNTLTLDELNVSEEEADSPEVKELVGKYLNIQVKIATALLGMYEVAKRMRLPDQITRANSSSSAVGPAIVDNYIYESQLEDLSDDSYIVDMNPENENNTLRDIDLFSRHPMLYEFHRGYDLANYIFEDSMPVANAFFGSIDNIFINSYNIIGSSIEYGLPTLMKYNRDVMNKFKDFFLSWSAVKKGVVSSRELAYLSAGFPKTISKKKEQHKDNYLVQNLYLNLNNRTGFTTIVMNISKIEKNSRDLLTASWADLYKKDKEFALNLFKYSFFRGGLNFSPKTFMNVLPLQMKMDIEGYIDLYKNPEYLNEEDANLMYRQFVSNNYRDNKIVPTKNKAPQAKGGKIIIGTEGKYKSFKNLRFFKTIKVLDNFTQEVHLYECVGGKESKDKGYRVFQEIPLLGGEGNFLEMSPGNINQSIFDVLLEPEEYGRTDIQPDVDNIPLEKRIIASEARKILGEVLTKELLEATKRELAKREGLERVEYIQRLLNRLEELLEEKGYGPIDKKVRKEIEDQLDKYC